MCTHARTAQDNNDDDRTLYMSCSGRFPTMTEYLCNQNFSSSPLMCAFSRSERDIGEQFVRARHGKLENASACASPERMSKLLLLEWNHWVYTQMHAMWFFQGYKWRKKNISCFMQIAKLCKLRYTWIEKMCVCSKTRKIIKKLLA